MSISPQPYNCTAPYVTNKGWTVVTHTATVAVVSSDSAENIRQTSSTLKGKQPHQLRRGRRKLMKEPKLGVLWQPVSCPTTVSRKGQKGNEWNKQKIKTQKSRYLQTREDSINQVLVQPHQPMRNRLQKTETKANTRQIVFFIQQE